MITNDKLKKSGSKFEVCLKIDVGHVDVGGGGGGVLPCLVGQRGEQAQEPVPGPGPLHGDGGGGVGVELDGPVSVGSEAGLGGQLVDEVLELLLLLGSSLDLT